MEEKLLLRFALILLLLAPSACARPKVVPPPPIEFLTDFSGDTPFEATPGISWYEKPGVAWAGYRRLQVEPPFVSLSAKGTYHHVRPDVLKVLGDALRMEMENVLGADYKIVREAAPDVVRVRIALSGLSAPTPEIAKASIAGGMMPIGLDGAAIEAEISDSLSGTPLAGMRDARIGQAGSFEFYKGFISMQYLRRAFATWGAELSAVLNDKLNPQHKKSEPAPVRPPADPAGTALPTPPVAAPEETTPGAGPDIVVPIPTELMTATPRSAKRATR